MYLITCTAESGSRNMSKLNPASARRLLAFIRWNVALWSESSDVGMKNDRPTPEPGLQTDLMDLRGVYSIMFFTSRRS